MKRAEVDNELYKKSKIKLHGLLSGMTTRDVDDRISTYRDSLTRIEFELLPQGSKTSIQPLKTVDAKIDLTELECPLALWKCIVHVTTTRTIGNTKVDQNNLFINFAKHTPERRRVSKRLQAPDDQPVGQFRGNRDGTPK